MASPWERDLVWPLGVGVMVACIALSLVALLQMFFTGWGGSYLVLFGGLATVEAFFSFRMVQRGPGAGGAARFRVVELALLFILLQLCVDAATGLAPLQGAVPRFSGQTVWLFILVWLCWLMGTETARDLAWLNDPQHSGTYFGPPQRRLVSRFFLGGVLLCLLGAVTQARVAGDLHLPAPASSGPLLNVFLYFLLGILLLVQVRYATLRQRWQRQEVAVTRGFSRWWLRYTLLFVGLIVVIALLLPTSNTVGLLELGSAIRDQIVGRLAQLLLLLGHPLGWLLRLLAIKPHPAHPSTLPHTAPPIHLPPQHLTPAGTRHHGSSSWLALGKALFFWLVIALAAGYLLLAFLRRQTRRGRSSGRLAAILAAMSRLWASLRAGWRRRLRQVAAQLPHGLTARPAQTVPGTGLLRFVHRGTLSPREQVISYYLSVVRRARRQGFPRRGSQTPREYGAMLAPHLSEAATDLDSLTNAFVEARYSRHEVPPARLEGLRGNWQRIRSALRRLKREPAAGK